jgi:hypothetical protein
MSLVQCFYSGCYKCTIYCHVPFVLLQVGLLFTMFILGLPQVHHTIASFLLCCYKLNFFYHVSIRVATSAPYYCHVPFVLLQVELLITTFLLGLLQVHLTIATFLFGNEKHYL